MADRIRVAILGARGVGQVHARIFHELGACVCAVLGSTDETAEAAAGMLRQSFDIQAQPFSRLKDLLERSTPDAVSVCTPPHLHFAQLIQLFEKAVPVFCEKPLFWHSGITQYEVEEGLRRLERYPERRLFVNTSNASLVEAVQKRLPDLAWGRSFSFQFYTQGRYRGKDIGYDLLPHGISMLMRISEKQEEITNVSVKVLNNQYECSFLYGSCAVRFDFREQESGQRMFSFQMDGREFIRREEGSGAAFRVYLQDSARGDGIPVEDPFRLYIARFLDFCHSDKDGRADAFKEADVNLRLMARILL